MHVMKEADQEQTCKNHQRIPADITIRVHEILVLFTYEIYGRVHRDVDLRDGVV